MASSQKLLVAIHDAIKNNTPDNLTAAKQAIIVLRNSYDYGEFPLSDHLEKAAENGNKEIVQWLLIALDELRQEAVDSLEEGHEISEYIEQDIDDIIHSACIKGATNCYFDVVEFINEEWLNEPTIEYYIVPAIEHMKPANFGKLFKNIDIDHVFESHHDINVLMEAAAMGNLPMVKYLFSKDVDTKAIDKFGNSVISYALSGGDQTTIAYIISHVDLDSVARELTSHGGVDRKLPLSNTPFEKWMI